MQCPNCKQEVKDDLEFCTNCGAPLKNENPEVLDGTEDAPESAGHGDTSENVTQPQPAEPQANSEETQPQADTSDGSDKSLEGEQITPQDSTSDKEQDSSEKATKILSFQAPSFQDTKTKAKKPNKNYTRLAKISRYLLGALSALAALYNLIAVVSDLKPEFANGITVALGAFVSALLFGVISFCCFKPHYLTDKLQNLRDKNVVIKKVFPTDGRVLIAAVLVFLIVVGANIGSNSTIRYRTDHELKLEAISMSAPAHWKIEQEDMDANFGDQTFTKHQDDGVYVRVSMFDDNFDLMDQQGWEKAAQSSNTGKTFKIGNHPAFETTDSVTGIHRVFVGVGYALVQMDINATNRPSKNVVKDVIASIAIADPDTVKVDFKDKDKVLTTIKGDDYGFGSVVTAPVVKNKEGYRLLGWTKDKTKSSRPADEVEPIELIKWVSDGDSYQAKWGKLIKVTFTDGQGKTLKTQELLEGETPTAPDDPSLDGFKFNGWDKNITSVTKDTTINAKWIHLWKVTFTDGSGKVLDEVNVEDGQSAVPPSDPTKDNFNFKGWDVDFSKVKGNMTVNATWEEKPTLAMLNAVDKAKSYLRFSAFSAKSLFEQLKFEGYTDKEAQYGVDHCDANWSEQAERKAEEYLKFMSFSRAGLIDQLEFEGFSAELAAHGADHVGL